MAAASETMVASGVLVKVGAVAAAMMGVMVVVALAVVRVVEETVESPEGV